MRRAGLELITLLLSILCCHLLEGAAWRQPQFENNFSQNEALALDDIAAIETHNSNPLERGEYMPESWLESRRAQIPDITRFGSLGEILSNMEPKGHRGRVLYNIMDLLKASYQKAAIECIMRGPYPCRNPLLSQDTMFNGDMRDYVDIPASSLAEDYAKARAIKGLVENNAMGNNKGTNLSKRGRMLSVDQSLHSLDRGETESSAGDRLESSLSKLNVLG